MPQKTLASQASIFDESLHVPDYHVINLLIENANEIPGFAFLLRYAKFLLEKSAGHINRYQWHSRDTICEAMQIQKPHLARYESKWLEAGWLSKIESKGRTPSKRLLGPKFDGVREAYSMSSNRYQDGTSNRYQPGTCNRYQPGTTNPNNLNQNKIKPHSDDDSRAHAYDQTNESVKKDSSSSLGEKYSPSYEIVSLSKRLERFYVTKKGDPSAYDWAKANNASERLLARGNEYVEKIIDHLEKNYAKKRFHVSEVMWESLCSEIDSARGSEAEMEYEYDNEGQWNGIDATPF